MPDQNKFDALRRAGFTIAPSCSACSFWYASSGGNWGLCHKITYEHQKHSVDSRSAGTPRSGYCPQFELDVCSLLRQVDSYMEFYEGEVSGEEA